MGNILIESVDTRLAEIEVRFKALTDAIDVEKRAFSDDENTEIDSLLEERTGLYSRRDQLVEQEERASKIVHAAVTNEPNPIYRKGDNATSYFRDLYRNVVHGDLAARARLQASQETRALSTTAGAGGEFAPPLWLVDEYVTLARAGRVTADQFQHEVLPEGVSSINLPKIATGEATAVQASQNTALQQTDMTTTSVQGTIVTIGGKGIVSQQLLDQSGIPFDRIILGDLARSYAQQVGALAVSTVAGVSGANAVTVSATTPTGAGSIFSSVANAIQLIQTNRFDVPTAIVMHPRRWASLLAAVDTANRPLVVPNGAAFNQVATAQAGAPTQAVVGTMQGLPVLTDPNIPTNLGAGTNQDQVFVAKWDDLWLYESALRAESFTATYADSAGILFRVLGYVSFIANRFPKSVAVLGGAGLVTPTF